MTASEASDHDTALARRVIELVGDLDISTVLEHVTDDFALEFPFRHDGGPTELEGDAAKSFLRAMPKLFTRMHMYDIVVHGKTASGWVVAEYKSDGLTKAGRSYPNRYVGFLQMRDGKVARWREYFDPEVVAGAFPS